LFNVGDSLRYHGRYRAACDMVLPDREGWTMDGQANNRVLYAKHKRHGRLAFYTEDMELAAALEPDETEAYFV